MFTIYIIIFSFVVAAIATFKVRHDGHPDSGVTSYGWEFKRFFSVMFLHFAGRDQVDAGEDLFLTRANRKKTFHSHAFNSLTIWLWGRVNEYIIDYDKTTVAELNGYGRTWHAGQFKWTPSYLRHYISAVFGDAWCLSIRGPWQKIWFEYNVLRGDNPHSDYILVRTLTWGRGEIQSQCYCYENFKFIDERKHD